MVDSHSSQCASRIDRRQVLKSTGVLATVSVGGLSGCLGSGSDDSALNVGLPPDTMPSLMLNEFGDQLESSLDDIGYSIEYSRSHGNANQFAAGNLDVFLGGPIEVAHMGTQQEVESVVLGASNEAGGYVLTYSGSPYEVENTGGPEASIDRLVEEGGLYGTSGFGGGSAPIYSLLYGEKYGLTFTADDADFNVQTVDLGALPEQLANENLDLAQSSPFLPGFMGQVMPDLAIVPVFDTYAQLEDIGYAGVNVGAFSARQEVWDNHKEAVSTYIDVMDEAYSWISNNPDEAKAMDGFTETMGYSSRDQAEFVFDYTIIGTVSSFGEEYESFEPTHDGVQVSEVKFGDEWISLHEDVLADLVDLGIVENNWDEYVSFEPLA